MLSTEEILDLKKIMENYRYIHEELNSYEKELDKISTESIDKDPQEILKIGNEIRKCVEKLNGQRESEKIFLMSLENKYGPGELNPVTLEYKLKNEN